MQDVRLARRLLLAVERTGFDVRPRSEAIVSTSPAYRGLMYDEQEPVAYISAKRGFNPSVLDAVPASLAGVEWVYLKMLAVLPTMRRRGYASATIHAFINDVAIAWGADVVGLRVASDQQMASRLAAFRAMGFVTTRSATHFAYRPVDSHHHT